MYLVTGATGSLGRRIVKRLCEQEQPVRAFCRLNSRYGDLESRGADVFIGDVLNPRDIERSLQGVKSVISAHGTNEASTATAQDIDYRANIDLIDSAKAAGAWHFTFVSVLGADRGYEDSPVFKAKREVEKYLRRSDLAYTILRSSGFANNLIPLAERLKQTGTYLLIGEPASRTSIVSTDDLAYIAAIAARTEAARNEIFAVGGPDVLQRQDIPKVFGQVLKREPFIINVPLSVLDGVRTALGFVNPELKRNLGTLRTLLANEFFCTAEEVARLEQTFDLKMESLESFIRRYVSR
ncbi:MAG: SDR family oxidoreductase [Cyanobacteria bacterium P01_A01_bin.135]